MQGYTGSFAINGVKLDLQPSEFQWQEPELINRDGNGRAVYPAFRSFVMKWGIMSTSELAQLVNYFNYTAATGTAVLDLPQWGNSGYYFYSYSGTYMNHPTVGMYFNQYVQDVELLITGIRV